MRERNCEVISSQCANIQYRVVPAIQHELLPIAIKNLPSNYTVTQLVCHIGLVTASVEVADRVYSGKNFHRISH